MPLLKPIGPAALPCRRLFGSGAMATTKEQIPQIVDRLSDERAEAGLGYLRHGPEAGAPLDLGRGGGAALAPGHRIFADPPCRWQELAAEQGVRPIANVAGVVGDFWPRDDSVDEFLAAVREWRRGG